jgi:hypothetical protein
LTKEAAWDTPFPQLATLLASPPRQRKAKPPRERMAVDKKMDARNKWIYQQCCKGKAMPYDKIIAELKRIAPANGWTCISSIQGICRAANRYAKDHEKAPIPKRQNL